jgi:Uma2 family endonuclease
MNKSITRIYGVQPKRHSTYRPKTLSAFRNWQPEDGFKYEWNQGTIEKRSKINFNQLFIAENLINFFLTLKPIVGGTLAAEVSTFLTPEVMRVPDLAYFSASQMHLMANNQSQVPEFAIEIISPSDRQIKILEKLRQYFETGVKVVWHIYPEFETVYVYQSTEDVIICKGETICSADSVIKGYEIKAKAIFQKP